MRTNHRVSALIFNRQKLLLIHRIKNGEEYYALPGGGVESEESPQTAIYREIAEELGIKITDLREVFHQTLPDRQDTFYTAQTQDTKFIVTGPEKSRLHDQNNLFHPVWTTRKTITQIPIYPIPAEQLVAQYWH